MNPCSACGTRVREIDGFLAFDPELAFESPGFRQEYFSGLAEAEAKSFWFRSRNALICWAVTSYASEVKSLLEIGCGTGFVLQAVKGALPDARVNASDIFVEGLKFAKSRSPDVELWQMNAKSVPFREEFDAIVAFDVLEHIDDDVTAIQQIRQALNQGGLCVFTVPQHRWLWSKTDEVACHQRRYEPDELSQKLRDAGFEILRSTSFMTFLLPAMYLARKTGGSDAELEAQDQLALPRVVDHMFELVSTIERALIRLGISFPIGGSRLVVARKVPS